MREQLLAVSYQLSVGWGQPGFVVSRSCAKNATIRLRHIPYTPGLCREVSCFHWVAAATKHLTNPSPIRENGKRRDRAVRIFALVLVGLCFLTARVHGFLPTHIVIGSPSPGSGSMMPGATLCSSAGEMLVTMELAKAKAACTFLGKFGNGVDCRVGSDSFARTCIPIPISRQLGTLSFSFPCSNTMVTVGTPRVTTLGCLRTQPAASRVLPTVCVKFIDSASAKVLSRYSVPLNGVNAAINADSLDSERGVFMALSLASAAASLCVESARRCSASAKRETASAACSFADLISPVSASASVRAPLARVLASPAAVLAWSASPFASPADFLAVLADVPASLSSCMLMDWMLASSESTFPSTQNSPATPTATRIHPTRPMNVIQGGACSRTTFRLQRLITFQSSYASSGPSKMTPHATNFVINSRRAKSWLRDVCQPSLAFSSALIASGESSAINEKERIERDNTLFKSFDKQMCAFAIVFIIVMAWRIVAEWLRYK